VESPADIDLKSDQTGSPITNDTSITIRRKSANGYDASTAASLNDITTKSKFIQSDGVDPSILVENAKKLTSVLHGKKENSCFFCLRQSPTFLLPACSGWTPRDSSEPIAASKVGINMCTPYTELALMRESLMDKLNKMSSDLIAAKEDSRQAHKQMENIQAKYKELKDENCLLVHDVSRRNNESAAKLENEKQRHDLEIMRIIAEHNAQLSEFKRLYKTLQLKQRAMVGEILEKHSPATEEVELDPLISIREPSGVSSGNRSANNKPIRQILNHQTVVTSTYKSKEEQIDLKHEGSLEAACRGNRADQTKLSIEEDFDRYDVCITLPKLRFMRRLQRLWSESMDEFQKLFSKYTDVESAVSHEQGSSRMKYAVNLTYQLNESLN
jgi:hypothetical protein